MTEFFPTRFFETVVPFLDGKTSATEVVAELASRERVDPLTVARLTYYRTLVERNLAHILGQLYPATFFHLAVDSRAFSLRYAEAHPARHFEPNSFGRAFPGFLEELAERDEVSGSAVEIADYEWLRYSVGVAHEVSDEAEGDGRPAVARAPRPRVRAILREYDHDVPSFVRAFHRDASTARLAPRRTYVLVHQARGTKRSVSFTPTGPELLLLARLQGVDGARALRTSSREEEDAAAARLIEADIIDVEWRLQPAP